MPVVTDWPELVSANRLVQWSARQCTPTSGDRFQETLLTMLELAQKEELIQPLATYRSFGVSDCGYDWVRLDNGDEIALASAIIEIMGRAQKLIAAVVTIGDRLEKRVSTLFAEKQALKAFALEEVGVSAQFELSTALGVMIKEDAHAVSLQSSSALFPGNDGIDIRQQSKIFSLAGGEKIGMSLSESSMLHPVKSASMIFGFGKDIPQWNRTKDCEPCKARDRCCFRQNKAAA